LRRQDYNIDMPWIKKIVFFLLVVFLFSSLTKNVFDYQKNIGFYQGYKSDYEKEKKKNTELKTQYVKINDLNEQEKIIRNDLNLLKPGEVAVLLPNQSTSQPTPTPTPLPNYLQWWQTFVKN
jgi:cell division protein FtsB